jgi:regulator of RNase E activity RraB
VVVAIVDMAVPVMATAALVVFKGGYEGTNACACEVDDGCLHVVSAVIPHNDAFWRFGREWMLPK